MGTHDANVDIYNELILMWDPNVSISKSEMKIETASNTYFISTAFSNFDLVF